MYKENIACCTLNQFEQVTGLSLTTEEGSIKEDLPPISQFLNRVLALRIELQNALFEEFELRLSTILEEAIASGTYEVGVETLKAEGFRVLERQVIYQHPKTGAETTCCTIEKRARTKVISLDAALTLFETSSGQLMMNERSGRIALALPTTSNLLADGSLQSRINLIKPLGNEKVPIEALEQSHWLEVDLKTFERLWTEEVERTPKFTKETFYLITGLLLPIWDRLPSDNMRVYRLQTDDGERILGRVIQSEKLTSVYAKLGIEGAVPLTAHEIYHAVYERRQVVPFGRNWHLRSSLVMSNRRLEIVGVKQKVEVGWLKQHGCIAEMIDWKLRVFVPVNDSTISIIEQIQQL